MDSRLAEIKQQIEEKLEKNPIESYYRHAFILNAHSQFNEEVCNRISAALRFDTVSWLIRDGYEPSGLFKIFTESFDYGNELGICIKQHASKATREFPIGARILLSLLERNSQLESKLESNEVRINRLQNIIARLEKPSLWLRFKQLFTQKEETHEGQDD